MDLQKSCTMSEIVASAQNGVLTVTAITIPWIYVTCGVLVQSFSFNVFVEKLTVRPVLPGYTQ